MHGIREIMDVTEVMSHAHPCTSSTETTGDEVTGNIARANDDVSGSAKDEASPRENPRLFETTGNEVTGDVLGQGQSVAKGCEPRTPICKTHGGGIPTILNEPTGLFAKIPAR